MQCIVLAIRNCKWSKVLLIAATALTLSTRFSMAQAIDIPTLEVISVRPNLGNGKSMNMGVTADGFMANNVPLSLMIRLAFQAEMFSPSQIIGMPSWAGDEHFDIASRVREADMPRLSNLSPPQRVQMMRDMAQAVLASRFQMKAHVEDRDTPMYALVVAKSGSKLKEAVPGDTYANGFKTSTGSTLCAGCMSTSPGQIVGQAASIGSLVNGLTGPNTGRVVVNQTGLNGKYDFELRWTPDQPVPPTVNGYVPAPDGPSVFTAVEEQLGLKLEPTRGPVKALVIEHIERPTEN